MSLVFRQAESGQYADVYERPSEVDLWNIAQHAPQQIVVNAAAIAGRGASLEWLSEISVPELIVHGGRGAIPAIPRAALRKFVEINIFGRSEAPMHTEDLHRLVGLGVDVDDLTGPLSAVPRLRGLALGKVRADSLALLSGCNELRAASLEYARGTRLTDVDLRCPDPPWQLESLEIHGAGICSLDGIEAFPRLRHLVIDPAGPAVLDHRIDLRPLAACPLLEWVVVYMNGRLEHAEVLHELTNLERFVALADRIDPIPAPAPWLEM
ncbi:hypothetical protein [uncultured Cellulomonas sp.]|uniref:hypothetical protein n=1 Tax=uncultured Cellulomonas sp. TaxID=189682 RepID=UPI0028EFC17A|nr:hypothetical protein [uncultured Cellulomonas sp.]